MCIRDSAYTFQNAWLGLLVGILFGVFYSLLYAVLCVTFSMNQVICGIGMNMFALGFTTSMTQIVWGTRAYSEDVYKRQHQAWSSPIWVDVIR